MLCVACLSSWLLADQEPKLVWHQETVLSILTAAEAKVKPQSVVLRFKYQAPHKLMGPLLVALLGNSKL